MRSINTRQAAATLESRARKGTYSFVVTICTLTLASGCEPPKRDFPPFPGDELAEVNYHVVILLSDGADPARGATPGRYDFLVADCPFDPVKQQTSFAGEPHEEANLHQVANSSFHLSESATGDPAALSICTSPGTKRISCGYANCESAHDSGARQCIINGTVDCDDFRRGFNPILDQEW